MIITSKDNETIKNIRKIKDKKSNQFIVEGFKMIEEAINEKANIDLIVLLEGTKTEYDISKFKTIEVSKPVFQTLTDVVTPQGIIAVINKKSDLLSIDYSNNFFIALDNIQDPGNLGTIIRTCDSAGLKQIIISKNTVNPYSTKVIRSTMGAIFRIEIIEVENLVDTLKDLKNEKFKIITTSLKADKTIYSEDYAKSVVVIGNEANGVEEDILQMSDSQVKIPMIGKTESLNASVSAGIMIYEYVRQKLN